MAELREGIVRGFDSGAYVADVQLTGSLPRYVKGVPVSRGIAGAEMTAGRRCGVVFFGDGSDPTNAAVFAVYV